MTLASASRRPEGLDQLLDSAGSFVRLSADDERAAARRLVTLRRERWKVAVRTVARLRRHVDAACKDSDDVSADIWSAKGEALVVALMEVDPDGLSLDKLERDPKVGDRTRNALSKTRRAYHRARNDFMCRNLRLVVVVAKRVGKLHLSLADRIQEGNLGLMKAIDRFDPERGHRFSTYAAWWIRHTVTRALMKHGRTVRIPAHLHARFNKVRRARPKLEATLGRPATVEELAEHLGDTPERVEWALDAMELRSVAIDAPVGGDDERSLAETLPDESAPEWVSRIEDAFDVPLAEKALETLDARESRIMARRYGLGGAEKKTLKELGKDYGLSRERIRQLQVRALMTLHETMNQSTVSSLSLA